MGFFFNICVYPLYFMHLLRFYQEHVFQPPFRPRIACSPTKFYNSYLFLRDLHYVCQYSWCKHSCVLFTYIIKLIIVLLNQSLYFIISLVHHRSTSDIYQPSDWRALHLSTGKTFINHLLEGLRCTLLVFITKFLFCRCMQYIFHTKCICK
jgi:hypothetical protein